MPINLAGSYAAGGLHDALLEIVKQRMLEQELAQRQEENQFQRLRAERLDKQHADETTYQHGRDTEGDKIAALARERQAKLDTGSEEDKQLTLLTNRPAAEIRANLGTDPTTGQTVPISGTPPGMPAGGGQAYMPFQNERTNPLMVRGMKVTPRSQEEVLAAERQKADEESQRTIAEAQARQVPRTVATGSFEDYVTRTYGSDPTPQQLIKARRDFGTADDRAAPVLKIQTVDAAGNPITRVMTREEAAGQEFAASPTMDQRNRAAAVGRSSTVLQSISELSERINTGQGVMARVQGEAAKAAAKANLDDDVAEYQALVNMFTPLLARAVGHVGVLTEQDVQSVRSGLPQPGDSKSVRDRKMARIDKIMGGMGGGTTPTGSAGGAKDSDPLGIRKGGG